METIYGLWLYRRACIMFLWKVIMEKKGKMKVRAVTLSWSQTNQAGRQGHEHHLLSLQARWWTPRAPSRHVFLCTALQVSTMEGSIWKGRSQSTQPRMENCFQAALMKNKCFLWEADTWCEKFRERDSVPHKMEVGRSEITHWTLVKNVRYCFWWGHLSQATRT